MDALRVWGAQCICGLVDALKSPGRIQPIEALRQIGPAAVESVAATLQDDAITRERLTSALKFLAGQMLGVGKSRPLSPHCEYLPPVFLQSLRSDDQDQL